MRTNLGGVEGVRGPGGVEGAGEIEAGLLAGVGWIWRGEEVQEAGDQGEEVQGAGVGAGAKQHMPVALGHVPEAFMT